jgi:hypothetical protein
MEDLENAKLELEKAEEDLKKTQELAKRKDEIERMMDLDDESRDTLAEQTLRMVAYATFLRSQSRMRCRMIRQVLKELGKKEKEGAEKEPYEDELKRSILSMASTSNSLPPTWKTSSCYFCYVDWLVVTGTMEF